jgi:hypothetical protein
MKSETIVINASVHPHAKREIRIELMLDVDDDELLERVRDFVDGMKRDGALRRHGPVTGSDG